MLLLGLDIGTSSIKASVVDTEKLKVLDSAQYPEEESLINSPQPGWAEQSPQMWWENVQQAISRLGKNKQFNKSDIQAVGISYQMHGLVVVDKQQHVLRDSIIWCDSRAVDIGNKAFDAIGHQKSLEHLLNSPGNFTAAKLAWVKENQPELYQKIDKVMLPGDYISMKLTGEITTSISALSEGVFWDFKQQQLSEDVFKYFNFDQHLIPVIKPVFATHGNITREVAELLGLKAGIPVTYKSGDQPNNALSLNVLEPGEVAATAGTSGVIYGVSDKLVYDKESRVNTFAHVNHSNDQKRLGILLCINGTGILNRWAKSIFSPNISYSEINQQAEKVAIGSEGIRILPFGNGAERMLNNKNIGAHFHNMDFNRHHQQHIFRAVQEGIAFAFRYGLDIMRENNMEPNIIRAGKANMFLSSVFTESFVNATKVPVELYENDGSVGAAIGSGIGAGIFKSSDQAFQEFNPVRVVEPKNIEQYEDIYQDWKQLLEKKLNNN
ncbi:MAG: xylulokinase [Candidatus Cyclobacteriaceae bacterium M2_1C_046]